MKTGLNRGDAETQRKDIVPHPRLRGSAVSRRSFIKRGALFVPAIFLPRLIRAQTILTAPGLAAFKQKPAGGGGGGGGSYTLLAHTAKALGSSGGASNAIDTTGATLIIVGVVTYTTIGTISDSMSNTWTARTLFHNPSSTRQCRFYDCVNPTVGSGHTFSTTGTLSSIFVLAFSGNAATPFDQINGNYGEGVSSWQPGSVTPSQDNEIVCALAGYYANATISINSSFTAVDATTWGGGANLAGAIAWKQQTTAGAENPTWTLSTGTADGVNTIATYK